MKLSNGTLRPGKVIEVLNDGCIKAYAPGLFAKEDIDKIPPIMPFLGWHANTFTSPQVYDEVWILNFSDNPMQLFWFRKDNYKENNAELIKEENVEVICNRESGFGWATIYFSDGSGWVIKNDDSLIQIDSDGNIKLSKSEAHRTIHINENGISLGSENKSAHPAAYADVLEDILNQLQITLKMIRSASLTNSFTLGIGKAIGDCPENIKSLISKISSPHVTID